MYIILFLYIAKRALTTRVNKKILFFSKLNYLRSFLIILTKKNEMRIL